MSPCGFCVRVFLSTDAPPAPISITKDSMRGMLRGYEIETRSGLRKVSASHMPRHLGLGRRVLPKMGVPRQHSGQDLFRWFSRATLGAMPLWLLTYKFTCSQAECGYHNALDAVVQADTPKTAVSQVGKSQHLCGRCGRPLTDSSWLKMAVPVPISSVEKKRPVSESGKQPSQNRSSR